MINWVLTKQPIRPNFYSSIISINHPTLKYPKAKKRPKYLLNFKNYEIPPKSKNDINTPET